MTQFGYDKNENLTRLIQPEGNVVENVYDERDLIFTVTRGAGSPEASTRTMTYDGNKNLIRVVDAADNNGDDKNRGGLSISMTDMTGVSAQRMQWAMRCHITTIQQATWWLNNISV